MNEIPETLLIIRDCLLIDLGKTQDYIDWIENKPKIKTHIAVNLLKHAEILTKTRSIGESGIKERLSTSYVFATILVLILFFIFLYIGKLWIGVPFAAIGIYKFVYDNDKLEEEIEKRRIYQRGVRELSKRSIAILLNEIEEENGYNISKYD